MCFDSYKPVEAIVFFGLLAFLIGFRTVRVSETFSSRDRQTEQSRAELRRAEQSRAERIQIRLDRQGLRETRRR